MHPEKFKHASASKEADYEMVAFGEASDVQQTICSCSWHTNLTIKIAWLAWMGYI